MTKLKHKVVNILGQGASAQPQDISILNISIIIFASQCITFGVLLSSFGMIKPATVLYTGFLLFLIVLFISIKQKSELPKYLFIIVATLICSYFTATFHMVKGISTFLLITAALSYLISKRNSLALPLFGVTFSIICYLVSSNIETFKIDFLNEDLILILNNSLYPTVMIIMFLIIRYYKINLDKNFREIETQVTVLQTSTAKLNQANSDLDQFAYMITHDLKAPLRAIKTLVTFIDDDSEKNELSEEVQSHLQMIDERSNKMEHLIDSVLKYSKAGKSSENPVAITLNQLVNELKLIISESENLIIDIPDGKQMVSVRQTQIEQVLQNLISNAFKFNDKNTPEITLSIKLKDKIIEFQVSDNGPGIDVNDFKTIFEPFKTAHNQNRKDSTGIGLSTVRRITNANAGTISVESELTKGTTFTVHWPAFQSENDKEYAPNKT